MDLTPCKSFQRDDLEVTKNPFDSREFDKENLPAFSPSIFVTSASKSSEKKNKSFRWSIDQIAALKPADIDEFPNQEYSCSYEREEDEIAAQNAINEYFSKVTLPSPWTRNKELAYKRVTFSPNPPTYFKETSYESIKSSNNTSLSTTQNDEETKLVDCSCQTMLTIPPNFDLEQLLGDKFFTYESDASSNGSKELNISTLRRKLFSQGDPSPAKDVKEIDENNNQRSEAKSASSTPRTPRTPNWITSSPFRDLNVHGTPLQMHTSETESVLQSSFVGDLLNSPILSPIKDDNGDDIASSFQRIDSPDTSFDLSVSSITNSMLKEEKFVSSDLETSRNDRKNENHPFDVQRRTNTMSVEPSESVVDVKESTRLALVELPGFSPIKNEEEMNISALSSTKYEYEIRYNGNSIKESTANHIHGITGLFSPINRNKQPNSFANFDKPSNHAAIDDVKEYVDDIVDDGGPLDMTDLSFPPDQSDFPKVDDDDCNNISDDVFQNPVVIVSPYPTPKRGILKHTSHRGNNMAERTNNYEHRFANLEQKIHNVEDRIENVKSNCESDIREIKRSLTPVVKHGNLSSDWASTGSGLRSNNQDKASEVSYSQEGFRPLDYTKKRKPLQDRTNSDDAATDAPREISLYAGGSPSKDAIVRKGYSALNRAKTVQRKIDEQFGFCSGGNARERRFPSVDNDDVEAEEVASILKKKNMERLTREGQKLDYIEKDFKANVLTEEKFNDYRMQAVRESLNDSWDLRSKGAMDIGEMDCSVMSSTNVDSSTPTPIMNLAGLTIYNGLKDNIPNSVPRPLTIDRRWIKEAGKIERRHTWPSSKSTKYSSSVNMRSISPPFPSKVRSSKSSFTKLDIVNRIKEEFKNRPASRTSFSTAFR